MFACSSEFARYECRAKRAAPDRFADSAHGCVFKLPASLRLMKILLSSALILLFASQATAQQTPYCAKVQEVASAEATRLMSPRLLLQGIRYPQDGQLAGGEIAGRGLQPRAAVSFSPTEFYQGLNVLQLGAADCNKHAASLELQASLSRGDQPRLAALRAEIAYLKGRGDEVNAWVRKAAARFAERAITLLEFDEMRAQASTLERRLAQAEGAAKLLEARQPESMSQKPTSGAAHAYTQATAHFARTESSVRFADPIQLQLTAGVIPLQPVDWYGLVELSVNVGSLLRFGQSDRYVKASVEEVTQAPQGPAARLRRYRAELAAGLQQAQSELRVIERNLELVARLRQVLETSEAPNLVQQLERIALSQVSLEADRAFLRALINELTIESSKAGR